MVSELKETEKTMSHIVQLLHDANEPAKNLVTSFGEAAKGGPLMEVIMRFASGTGLWKQLNYIKAIGITITSWNESGIEQRKQRMEQIANLAKEVKVYEDINKQKESELNINNEIYRGLEAMYGQEYARIEMARQINEAYDVQAKKMKDIKDNAPTEDLLKSIPAFMSDYEPEAIQRAQLLADRGVGELTQTTDYEGNIIHNFTEYTGVEKFFKIRWAKIGKLATQVGELASGLGKMIKAYFKGALIIIGQFLLWGAAIFLAIIILKPFIKSFWESAKKMKNTVSSMFTNFWNFIQPLWVSVWENIQSVWALLKDPKASFWDTIVAVMKLIGSLAWAVIGTLLASIPLLFTLALTVIGVVFDWILNEGPIMLWNGLEKLYHMFIAWWKNKSPVEQAKKWANQDRIDPEVISNIEETGKTVKQVATLGNQSTMFQIDPVTGEKVYWGYVNEKGVRVPKKYTVFGTIAPQYAAMQAQGRLARGGFVGRSGQYLVGEQGPELVNLPGGANVTPNHAMGNTINVHVNGRLGASDTELRQIAQKVGSMISREINRTTASGVRL